MAPAYAPELRPTRRWVIPTLQYVLAAGMALIVLIPLITTVFNGFKSNAEVLLDPFGLPTSWHPENYTTILRSASFWQQLSNSTLVMLATAAGVLVISSMAAFVFARMPFRGREVLFNVFMVGLLFPVTVAILPLYITLRHLRLIDSLWGVILPQIAFGLASNILILRGFFASIPRELEEAAVIDGCTPFSALLRISMPLALPGLMAIFLLTFVNVWNEFIAGYLLVAKNELKPAMFGLYEFLGQNIINLQVIAAACILIALPIVILFIFARRTFFTAMMEGAIKG